MTIGSEQAHLRERMLRGISKATNRIIALDDLIQDASSLELRQELRQERQFWQDMIDDNNDVLEAMENET